MRRHKRIARLMIGVSSVLGGGILLDNGCMNTIASLPICGAVLTFCTPADQLNLFFPFLQYPDFEQDSSCTIPLGCGDGDMFPVPPGFPGGDAPEQPPDNSGGGAGSGGGGTGGGGV